MEPLNLKQKNVYDAIKLFINTNGYSPTVRELSLITGYGSLQTTWNYLNQLKEKGYIDFVPHKFRTIKLKKRDDQDAEVNR